jgi:hypothetical protein
VPNLNETEDRSFPQEKLVQEVSSPIRKIKNRINPISFSKIPCSLFEMVSVFPVFKYIVFTYFAASKLKPKPSPGYAFEPNVTNADIIYRLFPGSCRGFGFASACV